MPRYIDVDVLKLSINKNDEIFCTSVRPLIIDLIDNIPTADVQEVKHGRWILDKEGTELVCSVCGGFAPLNYFKYHRVRSEYCPNCGAKQICKKEE